VQEYKDQIQEGMKNWRCSANISLYFKNGERQYREVRNRPIRTGAGSSPGLFVTGMINASLFEDRGKVTF